MVRRKKTHSYEWQACKKEFDCVQFLSVSKWYMINDKHESISYAVVMPSLPLQNTHTFGLFISQINKRDRENGRVCKFHISWTSDKPGPFWMFYVYICRVWAHSTEPHKYIYNLSLKLKWEILRMQKPVFVKL